MTSHPTRDSESDQQPTIWERYGTQRRMLMGGLAGLVAIIATGSALGSALLEVAQWPTWAMLILIPLISMVVTAMLTSSMLRVIAATLISLAFVAGGSYLVFPPSGDRVKGSVVGPRPEPRGPKFRPWEVRLGGATPLDTVIYEDIAWTLTGQGSLIGADVSDRVQLAAIDVSSTSRKLLLCGSYLILLSTAGDAALHRATDGKLVRRYPFGSEEATTATCSQSWLWIVRDHDLVRLAIPAMSDKRVVTKKLDQEVKFLYYWDGLLWALDPLGLLIGYDPLYENEVNRAQLAAGPSVLLDLGRRLLVMHRKTSCLRSINFITHREGGRIIPLTRDPSASGSDGGSAALADYSTAAITMVVEDGVRTYKLPYDGLRIATLAINDRWIILGDASQERGRRLITFRRGDLSTLETQTSLRLTRCP